MKKSLILCLLLTIILVISTYQDKLLYPFFYFKDLLFSPVHALSSNIKISKPLEESIINSLQEEISELQKLNNIKLSLSEFNIINATIISRNREYWFNSLTINKGKRDGIELDMAVIDSDGLIGRISMITNNTATVKLITTNDTMNKISAVIHNNNNHIYGIIDGYDIKNNLLSLITIDNDKLEKDAIVETTGMGGVFPSGILIGKVVDQIKKDDGITNIIRVKPSGNIKGEKYVMVLQRKESSIN